MPQTLLPLDTLDLEATVLDQKAIGAINPHRFEFRLLDQVIFVDPEAKTGAGLLQIRDDQFWVRGHIPGRPLFPGVLQIEAAAQLCSVITRHFYLISQAGFFGFVGVDKIRFRRQVVPGDDLLLMAKLIENRRIVRFATQALVDGQVAFSGEIQGTIL